MVRNEKIRVMILGGNEMLQIMRLSRNQPLSRDLTIQSTNMMGPKHTFKVQEDLYRDRLYSVKAPLSFLDVMGRFS
jgi:hypothetical protein